MLTATEDSLWLSENRITLVLLATLYPIWALFFAVFNFPGTEDSFFGRCVFGGIALVLLGLSYSNKWVKNHLMDLTAVACTLATAHYFFLVHQNQMHVAYAIGAFVTVFSISSVFHSIRNLIIYSAMTLLFSTLASSGSDLRLQTFFVIGIATALLVTFMGSSQRLRHIVKLIDANNIIAEQKSTVATSSKLSALGEMAGGIAHEINNPLAVISGLTEQLERILTNEKLNPEIHHLVQSKLTRIQQMVLRITNTVRGLRNFARDGKSDPIQEEEEVRKLITDTTSLCFERFRNSGVEIIFENLDIALMVPCRSTELSQSILNLLNNAFDAINGLPIKWIRIGWFNLDGVLQISITDSGLGLSPEIADKMFQPFFTTKAIGQGTGMGLSISRGLIERHGGTLVYDTRSANTRFLISVPGCKQVISTEQFSAG